MRIVQYRSLKSDCIIVTFRDRLMIYIINFYGWILFELNALFVTHTVKETIDDCLFILSTLNTTDIGFGFIRMIQTNTG